MRLRLARRHQDRSRDACRGQRQKRLLHDVLGFVCVQAEHKRAGRGMHTEMGRLAAVLVVCLTIPGVGFSQPPPQPPSPPQATQPPNAPPPVTYSVDVIETMPLPALNLTIEQVPAPVQTAGAADIDASGALDLSDYLNRRFAGVFVNETQGNPFQPDLNYRGYTASPLLGTPQGLSVSRWCPSEPAVW